MTAHSLADASFVCCSVPSAISRHIFAKCRNLRRVAGLAAVKAVRRQSLAFFWQSRVASVSPDDP